VSAQRFGASASANSRSGGAAAGALTPGPGSHAYQLQWDRPASSTSCKGYGGLASRTQRLGGRL